MHTQCTQTLIYITAVLTSNLCSPKNFPPVTPEVSVWDPPLESVEAEPSTMESGDSIQLSPTITIPANQKDIRVRVTHVISPANIYVQLVQYDGQLKRYQWECTLKYFLGPT